MVSPCPKQEESVAAARVIVRPGGERRRVVVAVIKPVMLVTLKVQDIHRRVVKRTMRRTDKLQGLMDVVLCTAEAGARGAARGASSSMRVKGEHTPEDLNMVSGDKIDFFLDLLSG
ncbi:LOW QUALITY PROTEIN: hypothetical protein PAHAL_2G422200 [Panicum hallii]|uniref:Uncharacterized protein n=1 Tax=Panicum hallii TaxID=206008 RepID=A0A2T8KSC8_9POAL|nr:LOW QUALITY PROTEIN: hypothetical protein PAHAL_2G422200 [Panicum hallii]